MKDFASNQYLFNLRGQLFERTDSSTLAKTKYTYNAFGDLKSVVLPNQTKIDYLIDGEHHRVGRLLNGNLDRYYGFDAEGRVLYERQLGAGGVFRLYIYLPQSHSPEAFLDGNTGVYYKLIKDHLGSIRLVINANTGIVAQELDYDEWGQVIKDTNPGFQLFGFAGGVYDKDTKLVRFGARDYDAETGRWTARDPLLFGGGDVNLYGYVGNDPVNWVDPSGLAVGDWWDLPANYGRAQEIASEEHANWAGHHNDWGDAMRHFEWSRRTTVETNSFNAFTAGWAHEIEYFFRRGNMSASQYLRESQMDVNNNALGRDAGRNGALMCPSNLTTQPRAGGY